MENCLLVVCTALGVCMAVVYSLSRNQVEAIIPKGALIGTHNSVTGEDGDGFLSALVAPFSECQGKTLAEQHAAGVRYFDLRVRQTSRGWICAHGLWESRRLLDDILVQLSAYSNTQARIWYEGGAPTGFVSQVESWKRRYGGIDIVQAGSRRPWRALKTWRAVEVRHDYLALDFSSWHTFLPIPWLWKRIYHDHPEFHATAYTMVDVLGFHLHPLAIGTEFNTAACTMVVFFHGPSPPPFLSAPPAAHGSRWKQEGVKRLIDATIEDARSRFNIDPDRVFLGGHSMGCYGAYHLGEIMADRFAGVWCSSGAWWETDFRAFLGTPVYIQHGARDCSPAPECHPGLGHARKHHWCGVDFARAVHELMTRYDVEHVYNEHSGGHSLLFPQAQEAMRRFFAWSLDKRRNPYALRCALVTPCGTSHPGSEDVVRSRWLELVKAESDRLEIDAISLEGPDVAEEEADLVRQKYRLGRRVCPQGARIVAENLGGNRFKVLAENVSSFRKSVGSDPSKLL